MILGIQNGSPLGDLEYTELIHPVVGGKMIFDTNQYKTEMLLRPLSFDSIALQTYSLNLCRCETKDPVSLFEEVRCPNSTEFC